MDVIQAFKHREIDKINMPSECTRTLIIIGMADR